MKPPFQQPSKGTPTHSDEWATLRDPRRHVALEGGSNFRDLGGYSAAEGKTVRWGQLYRSAHLGALTARDIQTLHGLRVAHVCDFRGTAEWPTAPCALPGADIQSLAIEPTVITRLNALRDAALAAHAQALAVGRLPETAPRLNASAAADLMRRTYADFVHNNTAQYQALFARLLASEAPTVFHCTAGKDRTGFGAALILYSLGVDSETIEQDFLLSNTHFLPDPPGPATVLPADVLAVLHGVDASYLECAWAAAVANWGSVDAYLSQGLGVDAAARAALQAKFLQ